MDYLKEYRDGFQRYFSVGGSILIMHRILNSIPYNKKMSKILKSNFGKIKWIKCKTETNDRMVNLTIV